MIPSSKNIFERIKEEHEEFIDMLEELTTEKPNIDTFEIFQVELKAHNQAEEQTLYESLKQDKTSREMALVGIEEHQMGTRMLNKLDKSEKHGENWIVQVSLLRHLLEKHIEVEEAEVIPMAEGMLRKTKVNDLSDEFLSIEEKLEE